jgi:hypothetical protein
MIDSLPGGPVLAVSSDAISQLDAGDVLPALWTRESIVVNPHIITHPKQLFLTSSLFQMQVVFERRSQAGKHILAPLVP